MATFMVHLDGGQEHPELTCDLTVEADDADAAKAFAEEHNGDCKATSAEEVK